MKSRPRDVENGIVRELNKWYEKVGLSPVKRIPAPGRRGPDATWNELRLIIDPKSRKNNPKGHKIKERQLYYHDGLYISGRLQDLDILAEYNEPYPFESRRASKTVMGHLEHLDGWREIHVPAGVSMIFLHWPNMYYENSVWVIKVGHVTPFKMNFNTATKRSN